jgi:hypothetical protein
MIVFGWNPTKKSQSALFIEDDIEMSPLYHWFLEFCLRNTLNTEGIIGCSFYSPIVNELSYESKYEWDPKKFNLNTFLRNQLRPFLLFQLPSSWGALYKADHWSEFQKYFLIRSLNPKSLVIGNVRSNDWEKSWKKFMIEFNFLKNRFLMYPSLGKWSFATNYFQPGVHTNHDLTDIDVLKKYDYRFTVPLLSKNSFLPRDINFTAWDEFVKLNIFHEKILI